MVTIIFDRPVAGRLGQAVDPATIFRIAPAVPGTLRWRDPITIRFIPDEPFPPGSSYTVTIDTTFRAVDGSRLAAPYHFSFRAPGPVVVARDPSFDGPYRAAVLPINGRIRLLYSAAVPDSLFATARYELENCARGTIPLRMVSQRPLSDEDPWHFQRYDRGVEGTLNERFLRVVELAPDAPPPPDCVGRLILPNTSDDAAHGATESFGVRTASLFRVQPFCLDTGRCPLDGVAIRFSAPVKRADVRRFVQLDPPAPFAMESYPEQGGDWVIRARLQPRTRYTLTVSDSLRDVHGRSLTGARTVGFTTFDVEPALTYPRGLLTIPRSRPATLPLRHANVRVVRVMVARIPDRLRARAFAEDTWTGIARLGVPIDTTLVQLDATFNVEATTQLALLLAARASSLVGVRLESASDFPADTRSRVTQTRAAAGGGDDRFVILQVTDLAAHAKPGGGESTVMVTNVLDGGARAGAQVRHIGYAGDTIAHGVTGSDGVARMQLSGALTPAVDVRRVIGDDWPPRVGMIEATLGDDRVILVLPTRRLGYVAMNPLDPNSLGARQSPVPAATAAVFADRDIHRPGEMVYLKGVIRYGSLSALALPPAGDSARLRLVSTDLPDWPNGVDDDEEEGHWAMLSDAGRAVVHDTVLRMSETGTIADSVRLRPGTLPGSYFAQLQVMARGAWRTVAAQRLRVAEYRAPEFLVDASRDSAVLRREDTLRVNVGARYLFGAPMGEAALTWSAVLHEAGPWEVRIPGAEGWMVGGWDWWTNRQSAAPQRLNGGDSLDASGRAAIALPLASFQLQRPGRIVVDVAVTDVNRQAVGASVTAHVHASELYILARQKRPSWVWRSGERTTIELRTVRPDGIAVRGVPVSISVVHRHWQPGRDESPWKDEVIATGSVMSSDSAVAWTLTPGGGGFYEVRLSAPDGRGDTARTTLSGYVVGGNPQPWWSGNPLRLPLVVDTRELDMGDETRVAFDSPFDSADAWFTIERERIIEQRHLVVRRGPNVVPLRLAEQHVPNAFVSVMLRRRSPPTRPDSAAQVMRVGYAELRVKTAPRRLAVSVEPSAGEYRPGDTATIRVRLRGADGRGARGEVTLWGVDEGVLALTSFATPDLLRRIHQPRGLGVGLYSTLATVLTSNPTLAMALRGASTSLSEVVVTSLGAATSPPPGEPPRLRTQFRSTAFWVATARTDSSGAVTVRAKLPDNLTTFRLMAVAHAGADRFGHGDTNIVVTRQLVARPTLPRFVRAADTLHAGAVVNVRDGGAREAVVDAEGDGIRLLGATRARLVLAKGTGREARFRWAVPARDSVRDSIAVRLRAGDGTHGDAVQITLPVRPDFHPRAHTRMGMLRDAADVVIDLPQGTDPARSTLSLKLGTSPLAPMLAAWEWLRVYPYHCTEQITSGGRALVAIWRATRERTPGALGGDPLPRLQALADEIVRRQMPGGAIRYWDDHDWSSAWLSAYAGLFLLEARDVGVTVDSGALARLSAHLGKLVATPPDTGGRNRYERQGRRLALGGRVAVLEYLRRAGTPQVAAEDAMLTLAPAMTWEDRLRLAEAVASRDDVRDVARAIVDASWRAVVTAGRRVDIPDSAHGGREFPSRIAPAARLLTASLALRPEHEWIGGLIETVLQQGRSAGRWAWSTQDYASVVIALAALPEAAGGDGRARVRAAGKVVAGPEGGAVPLAGLLERDAGGRPRLRLRLERTAGRGNMYFAATVTEVPSRAPVTPDAKGLIVERWYERFDTGEPVTSVKEGDLVRVRLRVTVASDRQFVVLEDPLPAGLEPVDLSLRTTALAPFVTAETEAGRASADRDDDDAPRWQAWLYGRWENGWWSPWEHKALHDDKVVYFARKLWAGSYGASYVARATTPGTFVRPPAHAEEMYNPALQGRSDGGRFEVRRAP